MYLFFHAVIYACVYGTIISFCLVFSISFNIITAHFLHQSYAGAQKIDSREGLFRCKMGIACEYVKMNFYLDKLPFAPDFGLFGAKCSAFCR